MDQPFITSLQNSKTLLILLPTKPYFDQVAAGLSLYLSVRNQRDTTIACPSPMTVEFNRLVGVNKVKSEMGNKNLVIRFTDYDGKDIERVSADLEDGVFKLTVIPKPSVAAPEKSQMEVSYSGISCDTVILVGGANESHFPILSTNELAGASLLHIGIRPLDTEKNVTSFVNDASSVSEVVSSLIVPSSLYTIGDDQSPSNTIFTVDADSATNLLMGIESSTNKLNDETATADTFYYVSELMRSGGVRNGAKSISPKAFPPGSIPTGSRPLPNASQTIQEPQPPSDWLSKPKIYKGGST